ncbi:hypothetical protein L596_002334 [Steinernema carpocapsae]|uniref:Uncharacterized protein n=1 Tax=Steinernema carpocapsae TaxID=34508 RepID=A0A4U8UNV5_STECR|nr:hypothetical protein L596_002334 [Steinernema carpocapsae]
MQRNVQEKTGTFRRKYKEDLLLSCLPFFRICSKTQSRNIMYPCEVNDKRLDSDSLQGFKRSLVFLNIPN